MSDRRVRVLAVGLAMAIGACGAGDGGTDRDGDPGSRELVVSAAASLADAFTDVEDAFEATEPNVDVVVNTAGSSTLRDQIIEGAPVDVFASANTAIMGELLDAGRVAGAPRTFAMNRLVIAVPEGNPASIDGLEDFARDGLLIGLCAEQVPCGDFARQALGNAGVEPAVDTNEPNVRALLTKIEAGELDAAITYATDAASAPGTVDAIAIPPDVDIVAEYPIAILADAANPDDAEAFVAFVLSEQGRAILLDHGFAVP